MRAKRVGVMAAVVGYGRSAMAVSVPALAALGCQPCAMPTAVLSSHPGGFQFFQMQDMTEQLERQIDHYKLEQIDMDALVDRVSVQHSSAGTGDALHFGAARALSQPAC